MFFDKYQQVVGLVAIRLGFDQDTRNFFANTSKVEIVLSDSTEADYAGAHLLTGESLGGLCYLEDRKISIFHRNVAESLISIGHEFGHAFASCRLGGDAGEAFSKFFEINFLFAAMDLGLIPKHALGSCVRDWTIFIMAELAPIYESLCIARNMLENPQPLGDPGTGFGFEKHTKNIVEKYMLYLTSFPEESKRHISYRIEMILRNSLDLVFGMKANNNKDWQCAAGYYDPVSRENCGFSTLNALMVYYNGYQRGASGSDYRMPDLMETMSIIRDLNESTLHHFAELTPENVFPAIDFLSQKVMSYLHR
ncbi:MAG: hypothetical protein LBI30_02575 [Holosporales bacterium]|jgi:hypothetical protein|nr:hypothetical protein [Holosporales bacterium]